MDAQPDTVPRLSCVLPPSADFPRLAAIAEQLGYHRVWAFDSPALYGDVWVALARAADATSRIGLATGVAVPFTRHPVVTASAIATVYEIAPGRLACAFGTGYSAARALGRKPMTWDDLSTYVVQVRGLLAGDTVEIDGAYCKMINSPGFGPPRPVNVELYLSPMGPKGFAASRRHADGIIVPGQSTVPDVEPGAWATIAMMVAGTVVSDSESLDSERATAALGPQIATGVHGMYEFGPQALDGVPGGPQWRAELEAVPADRRHLALHEGHLVAVTARDAAIVAAAGPSLRNRFWTGSAQEIRERFHMAGQKGITEVVFNPSGPAVDDELTRFAQAIMK